MAVLRIPPECEPVAPRHVSAPPLYVRAPALGLWQESRTAVPGGQVPGASISSHGTASLGTEHCPLLADMVVLEQGRRFQGSRPL